MKKYKIVWSVFDKNKRWVTHIHYKTFSNPKDAEAYYRKDPIFKVSCGAHLMELVKDLGIQEED